MNSRKKPLTRLENLFDILIKSLGDFAMTDRPGVPDFPVMPKIIKMLIKVRKQINLKIVCPETDVR